MEESTAQKIQEITQAGYAQISKDFSQTRQHGWPIFDTFLEYIQPGDTVLDIGCGNGRLVPFLQKKKVHYLGIDSNEKFIALAKKEYADLDWVSFQVMDAALDIDVPQNSYKKVFCLAMFNHIPSHLWRQRFLADVYRIVEPGGNVFMTNWNMWQKGSKKSVYQHIAAMEELSDEAWEKKFGIPKVALSAQDVLTEWRGGGGKKGVLYYYAFRKNEMRDMCRTVGFKILKNYYERDNQKVYFWQAKNLVTILQK